MTLLAKLAAATGLVLASLLAPGATAGAQNTPPSPPAAFGTACPEMTDSVYRLYSAYFLRLPDQGGFDFWVDAYSRGDHNLTTMSDFFASSPEFQQRYGALDDEAFIELVYANVLRRTPDREGYFFWLDELEAGRVTRGGLMAFFSESEEFVALTGTTLPLAGYLNAYPPGTVWACGIGAAELARRGDIRFMDLYLYNLGNDAANAQITLSDPSNNIVASGTWTLPVNNEVYVSGYNADFGISNVVFDVDADVAWIYVNYGVFIGDSRPGWGF